MVRNEFPHYFRIQIYGSNFTEERIYASNVTLCENIAMICNVFSSDDKIVHLTILPSMPQVLTVAKYCTNKLAPPRTTSRMPPLQYLYK